MSKMSQPTPLASVKRPEEITELNNVLTMLSIDERLRIRAVKDVVITKPVDVYTFTTSVTVQADNHPVVLAGVRLTDTEAWMPLPYIKTVPGASLGLQEAIYISSITKDSDGLATISITIDCNSTAYAGVLVRYIKLIVLKDKYGL